MSRVLAARTGEFPLKSAKHNPPISTIFIIFIQPELNSVTVYSFSYRRRPEKLPAQWPRFHQDLQAAGRHSTAEPVVEAELVRAQPSEEQRHSTG